jgi:hypothetical protein
VTTRLCSMPDCAGSVNSGAHARDRGGVATTSAPPRTRRPPNDAARRRAVCPRNVMSRQAREAPSQSMSARSSGPLIRSGRSRNPSGCAVRSGAREGGRSHSGDRGRSVMLGQALAASPWCTPRRGTPGVPNRRRRVRVGIRVHADAVFLDQLAAQPSTDQREGHTDPAPDHASRTRPRRAARRSLRQRWSRTRSPPTAGCRSRGSKCPRLPMLPAGPTGRR